MQSTTLKSRPGQESTQWRCVLRIHEAAGLLPRMSNAELRERFRVRRRGIKTTRDGWQLSIWDTRKHRYWRRSDRNIGIPTGSVSGFWVLDIDGDTGEASLRALEAKHGALPATSEVITGGGGRHLWFRYTGPIQSAADRIARGIDTRGDGGYVVVPPSIHESGRAYCWSVDSVDELAVAPDWLVRLARTKPQSISERALGAIRPQKQHGQPNAYGSAALNREIGTLAATSSGARNHALNRAAFSLFQLVAGGELDRGQVTDCLIDACHRNGLVKDDGIRSVMATIRSGMVAGLQHPRSRSGAA